MILKINKYVLLVASVVLITLGCEVEKIVLVEPELMLSSDTLIFSESETKVLFISTVPQSEGEFQITSYPDWVSVNPESGFFNNDIKQISITSNIKSNEPGLYAGKLEVFSTHGSESVFLRGFTGKNLEYYLPDTINFTVFDERKYLTVVNQGNMTLDYHATLSNDLINASKVSGVLEVGQQEDIILDLDFNKLESGFFQTELFFTIDNFVDTVIVLMEVFKEQKIGLSSNVIDAEYSKQVDKLFYVSSNPLSLSIFSTSIESMEHISLEYEPTCISVSSDGLQAVVGYDGRISHIDLVNKNVIKTIEVPFYVFDIAFGNNGWAYAIPNDGNSVLVQCINLVNNVISGHVGNRLIYNRSKIKLQPSGNAIYLADNGLSPSDIDKLDISNGIAEYLYDSRYHGDYAIEGDLWFSEDGQRIFARGTNVFKTSTIEDQDILYSGKITIENSLFSRPYIHWLDNSEQMNNLYLISSDGWTGDKSPFVYIYNSTNLVYKNKIELEKFLVPDGFGGGRFYSPEPSFVFSSLSGTTILVLTNAPEARLQNEWAIERINL